MSAIILHSQPMSVYLWTASLAAAEKGVSWSVRVIEPGTEEHRKLHPFAKSPVLQHGAIFVYETLAIAHYIDAAFNGPALRPEGAMAQADMLRWISLVNAYMFPTMTNGIVKQRLLVPLQGGTPDEALVANSADAMAHQLAVVEKALRSYDFLAGPDLTLADCFLFPHLHLVSMTAEGAAALARIKLTAQWLERMRSRPSFAATDQLGQRAA